MNKHFVSFVLLVIFTSLVLEVSVVAAAGGYDYSHRKRDCVVKIVNPDGTPIPGILIGIGQISNEFVFGGTLHREAFDSLGDQYGDWFQNYFDVASPDGEVKWEQVMNCSQKCDPDFSKADSLVNWLDQKKRSIYGNCLFSNEKDAFIPPWTRTLGTTAFKQAMLEHLDTTLTHFKGKVTQWDIISRICHGENGSILSSNFLETKSGDPNIFSWILDEARKRDTVAALVISDNGLIPSSGDQAAVDQFITKVKPLSSKFDLIGAESHFNKSMEKYSYEAKINYLAQQLGKPIMLTDIDFSFDKNQAPDKLEELMRTCFANPKVSGIIMGSWCERYSSKDSLTSCFIDSLTNETPLGARWIEVRDEWKTEAGGLTDDSGRISFTGFHGKYMMLNSCFTDTFYLEPGEGTQVIVLGEADETKIRRSKVNLKTTTIIINGIAAKFELPAGYDNPLFLTTYSLSGQEISRSPVDLKAGSHQIAGKTPGCRIFRIETADRLTLYVGKATEVR